ncbi:Beta-catenin-like protein [Globisporangium polare]
MEDHFARVLDSGSSQKRPHEGASRDSGARDQQVRRKKAAPASLSTQELDALVSRASAQEMDQLDARALKSMANALDKLIRKNALLRFKYPDAPEKFMDSEVALDEELTKWKQVAAAPAALYPQLVELEAVPMLLGLFAHENLDIRLDVIALLADLTDVDDETEEGAAEARLVFVNALLEHKLLMLLVANLQQLDIPDIDDKEEEAAGIYNTLQILENLADLEPRTCAQVCATTPIFPFLLKQVGSKRKFSQNKLYASEILSILLQSGSEPREQFIKLEPVAEEKTADDKKRKEDKDAKVDLLDDLLQAIAPFRKRDPASEEEEEFVENLVNSLCSVLLLPAAQSHFRRLEGIELVLRCMKDRAQYVFRGALRILNHTMMGNARNCERLVEVGGLKILFSVFMGKKKAAKSKNKRAKGTERAKEEENTMSIMASLCALLTPEAKYDVLDRFHAKFVENDMEKLDRVVDLFVKYLGRVEQSDMAEDDDEEEEEDEDERYLRRLDAGLFTLQRVTHVVAHLCAFSKKNRAYVMVKFHERSIEMDVLTQILKEQLEMLGPGASEVEAAGKEDAVAEEEDRNKVLAQKQLLLRLLDTLKAELTSAAGVSDERKPETAGENEDAK